MSVLLSVALVSGCPPGFEKRCCPSSIASKCCLGCLAVYLRNSAVSSAKFAERPRCRVVVEVSRSSSLAVRRACLRATSVAALPFGRGALDRFEVVGSGSALRSCSRACASLLGNSLQNRSASRLIAGASLSGSVSREAYVASRDSQGGWGSCSLRSVLLAFERRAQDPSWSADRRPRPSRRKSSGKLVELGRVTRRLKRTRELSSAVVPCGRSWLRAPLVACMGAA